MKVAAFVIAGCLVASSAVAQSTTNMKTPWANRIEQARTTLRVDADGLHGTGATVLGAAIRPARYVLIGEDHLSREIPLFTTGVCRLMVPDGLDAFAVEIGPEAARFVNGVLRRADRLDRLSDFMRAHPDALAFQNGRDESDMAAACARLAGPGFAIWGLDQEFFGASGYLLEQMLAARPGPRARAAIERLAGADRAGTQKALASGSPGDLFLYAIGDQALRDAETAIASDGGRRTQELFAALLETRAIYLGQNIDGFASNARRARLMKRTLARYLDQRRRPARVLFKFGDAHMAKGINGLGQRDVGNFVAERAEGEGASSLHIAVYGAKGIHALYGGVGRQVREEPFVITDDADYAWLKEALPRPSGNASDKDWTVIDLRSLRAKLPPDADPAWRDVIRRYDIVVVAPEITPSSLVGSR